MNIQHQSRTDRWFTPPNVLDLARVVLGPIELDPASETAANASVRADRFFTEADDGLIIDWGYCDGPVWLNPPGGKRDNRSLVRLFWEKLVANRRNFSHALFMAFSAEALQTTQGRGCPAIGEFPVCIPSKRLRFVSADGVPGRSPSHSNAVVYVPGRIDRTDRFIEVFQTLGTVMLPSKRRDE